MISKYLFFLVFILTCTIPAFAQVYEYMVVTTVESVVPGGLGRSRMISQDANGNLEEVEMENFFSMVGINFKNIRSNDKMIADKLNKMSQSGWELYSVSTGVYGADKSTGIFITRYLFRKPKK
ncbi:MAG: hypothetical protein RML72_10735 [Bacteroidia bacterium]|nr:hypothetical protein [Bacteroidia bacterium]